MHPSIQDLGSDIAETIREPFLLLDASLTVVAANKPFYQTFQVNERETLDRRVYDLGNSQWDILRLRNLLEEVLPKNAFLEGFEVEHVFQTIGRKIMILNARRLVRNEGRADLIFLCFEDATEIRKAESYRRLFEAAYDGILILNVANGKITDTNTYLPSLLGCSQGDLLGKELWEIGLFDNAAAGRSVFQKLSKEGRIRFDELPVRTRDGRQLDIEFVCSTYTVGDSNLIQCSLRDVSYRKLAEKALRQAENQLRQAQKSESIGKLAGGIAHEFNNLLTAINGYCALCLMHASGNPGLRDYLAEIQKAGERAASLTAQLLAYGRRQMLAPKSINLNAILTGMVNILNVAIRDSINLDYALDPELGTVRMDAGQLEQALLNLVMNAREAIANEGKIIIETRNVKLDEGYAAQHPTVFPGPYALLSVSDTGCGMDEQVKSQAFDPFFTTKGLGTHKGLGLSFVHGVVTQSGGHVFAYSEPGMGSSIKIYLPLTEYIAAEGEAPDDTGLIGTETVLIAEHEAMVRDYAKKILEMQGYRVLVAEDGEKALALAKASEQNIDLLITDLFMPGMNGKDLANVVVQSRPNIRLLYMSGYTNEIILHHGLLEKGAFFLQKPFSNWRLSKTVREALTA